MGEGSKLPHKENRPRPGRSINVFSLWRKISSLSVIKKRDGVSPGAKGGPFVPSLHPHIPSADRFPSCHPCRTLILLPLQDRIIQRESRGVQPRLRLAEHMQGCIRENAGRISEGRGCGGESGGQDQAQTAKKEGAERFCAHRKRHPSPHHIRTKKAQGPFGAGEGVAGRFCPAKPSSPCHPHKTYPPHSGGPQTA